MKAQGDMTKYTLNVWTQAQAQCTLTCYGHPAPIPKKKGGTVPNFRPMSRLDGSRCHLIRRQASPVLVLYHIETMGRWGRIPPEKGTALHPVFGPCLLWPWSPISPTAGLLPVVDRADYFQRLVWRINVLITYLPTYNNNYIFHFYVFPIFSSVSGVRP